MAWENHLNADCAEVYCRGSFFSQFIHPLHRREKKIESIGHVLTHGGRCNVGKCKCLLCYWI
ncbi:hypothetical protein NC651_032336 [Populus alba x Populus x berolinensis]|nr:hypothetical protein NC651_032336 [Populus alba x Populus x berolinensis]